MPLAKKLKKVGEAERVALTIPEPEDKKRRPAAEIRKAMYGKDS